MTESGTYSTITGYRSVVQPPKNLEEAQHVRGFSDQGKQFRVEPGTRLRIPTLDVEPGDSVVFDQILLAGDGEEQVQVGTPTVDGASVKAEVLRHGRDDKIIVFKRKRRKGYRKSQGHRQDLLRVKIDNIKAAGASEAKSKKTGAEEES